MSYMEKNSIDFDKDVEVGAVFQPRLGGMWTTLVATLDINYHYDQDIPKTAPSASRTYKALPYGSWTLWSCL